MRSEQDIQVTVANTDTINHIRINEKILEKTRDKDINFSQKCKTKKQPYHVINEAKQLTNTTHFWKI